jgi:hypothetical protein
LAETPDPTPATPRRPRRPGGALTPGPRPRGDLGDPCGPTWSRARAPLVVRRLDLASGARARRGLVRCRPVLYARPGAWPPPRWSRRCPGARVAAPPACVPALPVLAVVVLAVEIFAVPGAAPRRRRDRLRAASLLEPEAFVEEDGLYTTSATRSRGSALRGAVLAATARRWAAGGRWGARLRGPSPPRGPGGDGAARCCTAQRRRTKAWLSFVGLKGLAGEPDRARGRGGATLRESREARAGGASLSGSGSAEPPRRGPRPVPGPRKAGKLPHHRPLTTLSSAPRAHFSGRRSYDGRHSMNVGPSARLAGYSCLGTEGHRLHSAARSSTPARLRADHPASKGAGGPRGRHVEEGHDRPKERLRGARGRERPADQPRPFGDKPSRRRRVRGHRRPPQRDPVRIERSRATRSRWTSTTARRKTLHFA